MKCAHCKQSLPLGAVFCPHCGNNVAKQKKQNRYSAAEFILDIIEFAIELLSDILT